MATLDDELTEVAASASKSLSAALGAGLWATLRASIRKVLSRRGRTTRPGTETEEVSDRPAGAHQENTAYDSGRVYASQHGTQHLHINECREPK